LPIGPTASRTRGVGVLSSVTRSLGRWLRLVCAIATLLTIATPAALGAAMGPILDELGTAHEHVCKCGMEPGKCGCPECARAEQERLHDRGHQVAPILKSGCNQDAPAIQFAALPPMALAPAGIVLPAPRGERLARERAHDLALDHDLDPPTPPPRLAAV
jgi:hypothetical protein